MEKTNMKHLSSARCILLLLFYFVGYTYLLPRILTVLTLMVDPQATTFNIPISVVSYVMIMVFVIWVAKPIWLDSILQFKANWKKYDFCTCISYGYGKLYIKYLGKYHHSDRG